MQQVDRIKFEKGVFLDFIAKKDFALSTTGISIHKGSEIQFDGSTVIIDDVKQPYPNLRGAITKGWLVLSATYDPTVEARPDSAMIQVRPAVSTEQSLTSPVKKSVSVTVDSDEQVVLESGARAAAVRATNASKSHTAGSPGSEGEVVRKSFKTAARMETTLTSESAGRAFLETDVKIEPAKGLSEDEYLARLDTEARDAYLQEKEARIAQHLEGLSEAEKARYFASKGRKVDTSTSTVVSQVKTASKPIVEGGFTSTVTVGGGIDTVDLSGSGEGQPMQSVSVIDGIKFTNTNVGMKPKVVREDETTREQPFKEEVSSVVATDGTIDARKKVAKVLCSDFPDEYDFAEPWKKRLARIHLHYIDRPDVVKAIFAAESDDFKRVLLSEFPDAFAA